MYEYEQEDYFEIDENFEFNTGINKLLDEEVEKRLAERVKNYQEAIDRDKKSQKTISDLRSDMHKLQLNLGAAEKTFKKEGADDTLRELLGGFKLGDEVWFVRRRYNRVQCDTCLGDGKVIAEFKGEEMKVQCPKCNGYGHNSDITKSVEKGIIKEIEMHTWANGKKFEVKMYIDPTTYKPGDTVSARTGEFFKTEEECEATLKEE
ncbi:hypothetical protein [Cytobacillus purgationiresistens]|uniref:Zn finger protein HypA/HybF involved in hydrogenase expression n=1 Tax=Cytobacillus purgationiresistens TaxID=863449 RepID=A0ABU0ACC1_9BACI|nr:hypothetical protein [Cytobacillus purgationiresistens]MDQ0268902.1 Zn finger protein HypA/HybF involved in hydrogenase expression [Cytobacillus purgationiresistens]